MKGLVIGGDSASVLIRQKSGESISLGELLVAEADSASYLLQVFDLQHGSQLTQQQLEMVSGFQLEENTGLTLHEPHLRHYVVARAKPVLKLQNGKAAAAKTLPVLFGSVRAITPADLSFLENPASPLPLGSIRSGSEVLPFHVALNAEQVLSHHVLVTGTTGRGKSVCMANLFWHLTGKAGLLVLDPHDEYFCGIGRYGLCEHPLKERVVYYTPTRPPPGARSLRINIAQLEPYHFEGSADWSDAQREALYAAYTQWGSEWVVTLLSGKNPAGFKEGTLGVVRRRLCQILNVVPIAAAAESKTETDALCQLDCRGIFDIVHGSTTIADILSEVCVARTVIVDTSELSGGTEVLLASILAGSVLDKHKSMAPDELSSQPVISIALEEAPRVLGQEVLSRGPNVFATIAREGRKFRVGLIAVTQLPSLIPRDILANLNTKIILGMELRQERQAIIESAAQDLSQDDRAIAALDKGEAIVTSTFARIALPIRIPPFDETVKRAKMAQSQSTVLVTGMKM